MTDLPQTVNDDGDIRRYFTIIENMADDDLGVYEYRLLAHYKRKCGANGGQCTESVRTTAKKCQMSAGQVSKSRRELERLGWIASITHTHQSEDGKTVIDGISVTLINRMAENIERYSQSEQGCSSQKQGVHPVKQRRTSSKELKKIELSPANAVEFTHDFMPNETVYVWSDKLRSTMPCEVVKVTPKRVYLRWTNGSAVKEFYRAPGNVYRENPAFKTLDDFTPRQQAVMRWTRNVKPGEGIPGDTVEFANTVLKQIDIRFGTNGNAPDAAELDAAWGWAKVQGLTYRDPAKIPTMINDYRDTCAPSPQQPQSATFTFNPAAPPHNCIDGMVITGGKTVQCPVCAEVTS